MKFTDISDRLATRHQSRSQGVSIDVVGDGVEEDEGGLCEERPGAGADQEDDHEGEDGVEIVLVLPVGQPDHGGADQDHHAAESVRQNVEEDAVDIELLATGEILSERLLIALNNIVSIIMAMTIILDIITAMVITLDMIMTVSMAEYRQSNQVDEKSNTANNQEHLGVLDPPDSEEPLDRLEEDGEALGVEEDRVDESPDHFNPRPAEGADFAVPLGQSGVVSSCIVAHCLDSADLKLTKAMMRAMTSLNMWKLSATRAMELVRLPTTSSTIM